MSDYKFIAATAKRLEAGEVATSDYATAGEIVKADGTKTFGVYDDVAHTSVAGISAYGAAMRWHAINIRNITRGR